MLIKIFCRVIIATAIVFSISFMMISSVVFADANEDITGYTTQIKSNPNDTLAYLLRGHAYANLKKYDQAIQLKLIFRRLGN